MECLCVESFSLDCILEECRAFLEMAVRVEERCDILATFAYWQRFICSYMVRSDKAM